MTKRDLVRVALGLLLGTAAYIVPFGAVTRVLLPARIAEVDPAHKVALVAALGVGTALAGLVGNLAFGALSDRTLARWRGRLPWLVGGAVVGAALMVPLVGSGGVMGLLVWWLLAVAALNATTVSVFALLPDLVVRPRRATLAAVAGVGNLLGTALGTTIGAALVTSPSLGVISVAGLTVALAIAAAAALAGVPPAHELAATSLEPLGDRVDRLLPRAAPDFWRAFGARLLLVLSYFMIYAFELYIFTDHVGLDIGSAARALALTSVLFLATALIGTVATGIVSDRAQRRKPVAIGCAVLFLVAVVVPIATPTVAGMIVFSLIGGLAVGSFYAVDVALMSEVLPSAASHGRDLGILNIATTLGQLLGPVAGSALLGLGHGYGAVFAGAAAVCALGVPFLSTIRTVR